MAISVPHTTPEGRAVVIDADVLGVDRQLRDIDPDLCLVWDNLDQRFEVWHNRAGWPAYRVAAAERCDARLVDLVHERDNHRIDVLADIDAYNDAVRAQNQARFDEWHDEEFAPRFQWALRRDLAQHLGGRGGVHHIKGKP